MSFPGHAKSIKISQGPQLVSPNDSLEIYGEFRVKGRSKAANLGNFKQQVTESPSSRFVSSIPCQDDLVDDRGNKPSRSLWIGNTSHGLRNSELYEIFGAFGPIESATTKPTAKYSFVNFEDVRDAISAWKELNGKPIFREDQPLYIRFTATEVEAKKSKDDCGEKRLSVGTKAQAAKREWFQESREDRALNTQIETTSSAWPNGLPPAGPKSHRKDVSPPPLRRGDTYRPSDRPDRSPVHGRRRSGTARRASERDEGRRGREMYRLSNSWRPISRSRSTPRSYSDHGSRSPKPRTAPGLSRPDSPLPWERQAGQGNLKSGGSGPQASEARKRAQMIASNILAQKSELKLDKPGVQPDKEANQDEIRNNERLDIHDKEIPDSDVSYSPRSHMTDDEQEKGISKHKPSLLTSVFDQANTPFHCETPSIHHLAKSKSPSTQPNKRLRIEKDEVSSTISEVTSSTRSSLRRRKCTDCKKSGSDLSPLTKCSTCPRRFHSACGDPRPSQGSNKLLFVCGRCHRNKKIDLDTRSSMGNDQKSQLASPPLSLNNNTNEIEDTSAPPGYNELRIDTSTSKIISFFQLQTPQTPATMPNTLHSFKSLDIDTYYTNKLDGTSDTIRNDSAYDDTPEFFGTYNLVAFERMAQINMQKYKAVTCHWWRRGQCWLKESQCLYAHTDTGIYRPDDRHQNKSWTCWEWLDGRRCPKAALDCVYAHEDTGLHLGSDGRISLKHITCIWWIKANSCKWSANQCRFAHADTGVYALDPADKRSKGSAITSTRPVSTWKIPTNDYRNCEQAIQAAPSELSSVADSLVINKNEEVAMSKAINVAEQTPPRDSNKSSFKMKFDKDIPVFAQPQWKVSLPSVALTGKASTVPNRTSHVNIPPLEGDRHIHGADTTVSLSRASSVAEPREDVVRQEYHSPTSYQIGSKLDPRRRKAFPVSGSKSKPLEEDLDTSMLADTGEVVEQSKDVESATASDVPKIKINKCKVCTKIVFNDVLCRGCKEFKTVPVAQSSETMNRPSTTSTQAQVPNGKPLNDSVLDEVADFVMDGFNTTQGENKDQQHDISVIKPSSKRSTSGDIMFISNKRRKLSIAFSHTSLRPVNRATNLLCIPKSPAGTIVTSKKPDTKTLEQLTLEARIQNGKVDDVCLPSPRADTKSTSVQVTPIQDHVGKESDKASKSQVTSDDVAGYVKHQKTASNNEHRAKYVSPARSPLKPHHDYLSSESDPPDIPYSATAEPLLDTSKADDYPGWSQSSSPEVPKKSSRVPLRACQDCNEKHRRCTHKIIELKSPEKDLVTSIPDKPATVSAIVDDSERINFVTKTPLPFVCGLCRRHHKKCLHDGQGKFDPHRCLKYTRERSIRTTDRSAAEWDRILAAAELAGSVDENAQSDQSSAAPSVIQEAQSNENWDKDNTTEVSDNENEEKSATSKHYTDIDSQTARPSSKIDANLQKIQGKSPNKTKARLHDATWTTRQDDDHIEKLKRQGVMFEDETDEEDDINGSLDDLPHCSRPIDPLRTRMIKSYDLFDISPELNADNKSHQMNGSPLQHESKVSRKQEWKNLRATQLQMRRTLFGNPHREVDRKRPETMVNTLVERVLPGVVGAGAISNIPTVTCNEELISFRDFLGLPKQPAACVMEDRYTLAYRDTIKDNDRTNSTTSTRGFVRQVTEEDKLPVYDR